MSATPADLPTALTHIQELRRRLISCVTVLCIGAGLAYGVRGPIIAFLQRPLGHQLFYTSPTGSFEFVMQVCLLSGFLLALPICLYHLLRFIEPAFTRRFGRGFVTLLIAGSFSLALAGVAFAYYVSLPAAFRFFNAVGTSGLHPLITIDQYFSFMVGYLATFAVIFQLPLVLLFINNIKPLGPSGLSRWRKWIVLIAFAVALIMPSAPDPLSQVILALPIIVLYEISIWLVRFANHRRARRAAAQISAASTPQPQPATPAPAAALHSPSAPTTALARSVGLRPARSAPRPQPAAPLRPLPRPAFRPTGALDLSAIKLESPVRPVPNVNILDLRPPNA